MFWTFDTAIPVVAEEDKLHGKHDFLLWQYHIKNLFIINGAHDVLKDKYHDLGNLDNDPKKLPHYWVERNAWAEILIEPSVKPHIRTFRTSNRNARDMWIRLEKAYEPRGFRDALTFLREFEQTKYSPEKHDSVYQFNEALYRPVYILDLMNEEFKIPDWMLESRFIECIYAVHGPILEPYLMAQEQRRRCDNDPGSYDHSKRILDVCGHIEEYENRMGTRSKMHDKTVTSNAESRR